tara:strand:+ start:96 stop:1076 length:981 start_codon:yes stop_codon:yes gene_type:complete
MTSEERAALRASLDPTYAQPAPAPAPAAKKSTTSGSGRGVSGRGRDSIVFKEATPEQLAKDQKKYVKKFLLEKNLAAIGQDPKYLEAEAMGRAVVDAGKASDYSSLAGKYAYDPENITALGKRYGVSSDIIAPANLYHRVPVQGDFLSRVVDETKARAGQQLSKAKQYLTYPGFSYTKEGEALERAERAKTYAEGMAKAQTRDESVAQQALMRLDINELVAGPDGKQLGKVPQVIAYYKERGYINPNEHLADQFKGNKEAEAKLNRTIKALLVEQEKPKSFYDSMMQTVLPPKSKKTVVSPDVMQKRKAQLTEKFVSAQRLLAESD